MPAQDETRQYWPLSASPSLPVQSEHFAEPIGDARATNAARQRSSLRRRERWETEEDYARAARRMTAA
jgi:hypothetical protein